MDGGRRLSGSTPVRSNDPSAELWTSSPVKKKLAGAPLDASLVAALLDFKMASNPVPADAPRPCRSLCTEHSLPASDPSSSTIQRQRRELQLLMAELKDRDTELNNMAASHHQQLHAWENDRQRVLSLEQRCARLDDEVKKRNEVIGVLTKRVYLVETREEKLQEELRVAQQQLSELEQKRQHFSQTCQDLEEKNQSLSSTVTTLSTKLGSLQVREEELSSLLKLKDKDVTEASSHVRELEASLTESRSRESALLRGFEENKRRYRESSHQVAHLEEELQQQVVQSSAQREEMIRLKQELHLALSGEGDSWKDELLELARSKQERTMSELRCLRQVCENQRNDLQMLQLNLDSACQTLKEKTNQGPLGSQDPLACSCLKNPAQLLHDPLSPARLRGSASGSPGALSAHMVHDDDPLSGCSLQQLLDETMQVISSAPTPSFKNQILHHLQSTPKYKQTSETPPRTCPHHGITQTCGD